MIRDAEGGFEEWLEEKGIDASLSCAFYQAGFTDPGELLHLGINEDHLKELGVGSLKDRLLLINAIRAEEGSEAHAAALLLRSTRKSMMASPPSPPASTVSAAQSDRTSESPPLSAPASPSPSFCVEAMKGHNRDGSRDEKNRSRGKELAREVWVLFRDQRVESPKMLRKCHSTEAKKSPSASRAAKGEDMEAGELGSRLWGWWETWNPRKGRIGVNKTSTAFDDENPKAVAPSRRTSL